MFSPRNKFVFIGAILMVLFSCSQRWAKAQTTGTKNADAASATKPFMDVQLTTNYVEKGITQSDSDPALQAAIGYQAGRGKLGVWSSNVKYPGGDEHLNLRLFGSYKLVFTDNVDLTPRYDWSRYFKSANRNGSIISLDLNLYTYHVLYDRDDNFEGFGTARTYYGFRKEWPLGAVFTVDGTLGYSMIAQDGYNNYFDTRVGLNYKLKDFALSLVNTFNSNPTQFSGRADLYFFLVARATF